MRIAQVAPLIESVPPRAYGGTERVVSYLTESLVEMGHEVTLFASGDSVTRARLVPVVERGIRLDPGQPDWLAWTMIMLDRVFDAASRFDIIHSHVDYLHFPLARRCKTPCVTTLHGRQDLPDLPAMYQHFREQPVVSISDSQRDPLPLARWCATVHHGLPENLYQFHPRPQDYFVFIGRMSPEKRVDRAIDIAVNCGTRIRIGAKVDVADRSYFESQVRPLLGHPLVDYVGEVEEHEKNDFIGNAQALLFPIDWPEPFGLVMIEALACGTPVIGYPCGSVTEILEHGVTGYVVNDRQQAIAAARRIDYIDRRQCRRAFEERFTARVMAERYVDVYQSLTQAEHAPALQEA
jgi:glycosyltransferase involved in cell wall biosynthesis